MTVLVVAKFPSIAAVFMACTASVLLLVVARIMFALVRLWSCPIAHPEGQEKESSLLSLCSLSFSKPWRNSLQWNTLPVALPFALRIPEKPSPEAGNDVGATLQQKRPETLSVMRTGKHVVQDHNSSHLVTPTLYESPVPLSMAKIIMSRHTFRRPNPNRSRRTSLASSSRATTPPQTPSRLYHSIA
ncbi:hypothetical protein BU15DRAFT_75459 [Melanogaster broomeanus]|nr:hypothetical protein BU15DRAFT_75459 [Melanogaster broomeanus]